MSGTHDQRVQIDIHHTNELRGVEVLVDHFELHWGVLQQRVIHHFEAKLLIL
jgi:hypothetical protein